MKPAAKERVNLHRLDEAMDARGLDALVARAGLDFTYLAGFAYPGTRSPAMSTLPTARARSLSCGRAVASRASC